VEEQKGEKVGVKEFEWKDGKVFLGKKRAQITYSSGDITNMHV